MESQRDDRATATGSRLRTPVGRAVVPVLAGLGVLAALLGSLWLIAAAVTRNADQHDRRVGADVFEVGRVDHLADSVARDGPILFPNLAGEAGRRPVGLDHDGPTDFEGWRVFSLRPSGAPADCLVSLDRTTKQLTDCNGRTYTVDQLPPAQRVEVIVDRGDGTLTLDLQPDD